MCSLKPKQASQGKFFMVTKLQIRVNINLFPIPSPYPFDHVFCSFVWENHFTNLTKSKWKNVQNKQTNWNFDHEQACPSSGFTRYHDSMLNLLQDHQNSNHRNFQ